MKRVVVSALALAVIAPSAPAVTTQGNMSFLITSAGSGDGAKGSGLDNLRAAGGEA